VFGGVRAKVSGLPAFEELTSVNTDLSTKCCLMYDYGLFAEVGMRLARDFGQVYYYSPWKSSFCHSAPAVIGTGLAPNMERVLDFWDYVPEADVVVFGEIPDADMQRVVREKFHKPVLGHGDAERLETDRWGARKLQKKLGLAAPNTKFFRSVDDLVKYLKANDNKWVKLSMFRGDQETFHHDTWIISSIHIDKFRNKVGALQDTYEFMVEEHIDGVEIGYDGWHVKGEWPEAAYCGFEVKGEGYVGRFMPYREMPKQLRDINAAVGVILKEEGGCGFCSFEFRVAEDGIPYLIDPCMRFASPPTEAFMEGYTNFSDIIWNAANGRMIAAECGGEYAAIAMIYCDEALENWVPIDIPDDIRQWVKIRNATVIDGKFYHAPTDRDMSEIGSVVAIADTLDEARELVKERAKRIKGFDLDVKVNALDTAEEEIEKAEKYGIHFS
jgi:phosphoribosylamine-glycine ligase